MKTSRPIQQRRPSLEERFQGRIRAQNYCWMFRSSNCTERVFTWLILLHRSYYKPHRSLLGPSKSAHPGVPPLDRYVKRATMEGPVGAIALHRPHRNLLSIWNVKYLVGPGAGQLLIMSLNVPESSWDCRRCGGRDH